MPFEMYSLIQVLPAAQQFKYFWRSLITFDMVKTYIKKTRIGAKGKTRDHMIPRKGGSSAKIQHAQDTYWIVNEEFRRNNYSRATSRVIKIWKDSDNKPDIHAVKKKRGYKLK